MKVYGVVVQKWNAEHHAYFIDYVEVFDSFEKRGQFMEKLYKREKKHVCDLKTVFFCGKVK